MDIQTLPGAATGAERTSPIYGGHRSCATDARGTAPTLGR